MVEEEQQPLGLGRRAQDGVQAFAELVLGCGQPPTAEHLVSDCQACASGRSVRTSQRSGAAAINLGNTPADNSEDLPEPEGPTTSRKLCSRTRRLMSSLSPVSPEEQPGILGAKGDQPGVRAGQLSAGGAPRWSSSRRREASASHRDLTVQSSRTRKSRCSGRSYGSRSTGTSRSEFRLKVSCVASNSAKADHGLIPKAGDKTRTVNRAVSTARSSS